MGKIEFQGTVLKYLLALLVVSAVASFIQDGTLITNPTGVLGIVGIFALLFIILASVTSLLRKNYQKPGKKKK